MKKNGEGSKIISCSSGTRRDSLERRKERKDTKEMPEMQKFVTFWGGIWEKKRGKNPIYAMDERDKKTIE